MIRSSERSIQFYSPFGTYVIEQHDEGLLRRFLDDLPRPDLNLGKDHPLAQDDLQDRRAA